MSHAQRVFLADDDDDMRSLMRVALERGGCKVVEAHDGAELITLLQKTTHTAAQRDVIVTDVRMPNFSGLGVLRTLRQTGSRLPVILITAAPDVAVRSDALQWGASVVLTKPFEMAELLLAISDAAAAYPS